MLPNPNQNIEEDQKVIDHRQLFVTNLPYDARLEDLSQFFKTFGKITNLSFVFQKNNRLAAAIVTYENENDACSAMNKMQLTGKERARFDNRVLHVEFMQAQHRTHEFKIRKRVNQEDARRIYDTSLIDNHAAKDLCQRYEYSGRTYYNIIENQGCVRERYKRHERSKKWDREDINHCVNIIEEHPTFNLNEIKQAAEDAGNVPVSLATLKKYLDHEVILYKDVGYRADDQNSPETKAARVEYVNRFKNEYFIHTPIHIGVAEYSLGICEHCGYHPQGQQANLEFSELQSKHNSNCCAINGINGLLLHRSFKGALTELDFRVFIVDLVKECKKLNIVQPMFNIDNRAIHLAAQLNTLQEFIDGDFIYDFLPPYSPNLNPIETIYGSIKEKYNLLIATEYRELLLETHKMPHHIQLQHKQSILENAFEQAIDSVSLEEVQNAYGPLAYYLNEAKQNHDI